MAYQLQLAPFGGHFGAIMGPFWGRIPPDPTEGSHWGSTPIAAPFWGHLGPFWGRFGVVFPLDPIAGSILNWGPILGQIWGHFGVASPRDPTDGSVSHLGSHFGVIWGRFGAILGSCSLLILLQVPSSIGAPFWGHLGPFWGHFGFASPH